MEFQRKSELDSKAVSMITMSGTIATLFMGFGSILLRDIPIKDWTILISGSIVLFVEVLLTTFAIKYSLDAYKFGKPYFYPTLSNYFNRGSKNQEILTELRKLDPEMFNFNLTQDLISAIPKNSKINDDKMERIFTSQTFFLYALSMLPVFAFVIMIYKFLS